MASSSSTPFLPLLLFLCIASGFIINASADNMAIYWGWHNKDVNFKVPLRRACETKRFSHVSIAFLSNFGNGRSPMPDLGNSCDAANGGCKTLQSQIAACQRLGVKVLLSIGGLDTSKYTLASSQDAHQLASHIFDVYLSGFGIDGPFGSVKLDGVDFFINDDSTHDYWDVLAEDLKQMDTNIQLTASQGCNHTAGADDMPLYNALKTGRFSKVWPRFYGRSCNYVASDPTAFKESVENWATDFSNMDIYLGLTAHPDYLEGWISQNDLPGALEIARQHSNFQGVMLWNRNWDVQYVIDGNDVTYSEQIESIVKNPARKIKMGGRFF